MKAVRIDRFGSADVLNYGDLPQPEPGKDQLLLRVIAAAVNPVDAAIRQGRFREVSGEKFPLITGYDVAGVVEKVGANITRFKIGDAVYAFLSLKNGGGYAQYAISRETEASPKPKGLTFEEAAAVPLAASTAWQALIETAKLHEGQTVLIHGGSGGVGSFAIQIAKAKGATVIATASAENQELLKQLGADRTIDYKATKFEGVVKDVDVVLDTVGRDTLTRSYDVVRRGGIVVTIIGNPDPGALEARGIRGAAILVKPDANVLAELTKLIEAKKLRPIVSHVLPLAEAAKAHELIETHHTRGKIVLRVASEAAR